MIGLEAFEDFSWGRVAFKFLMESGKKLDLTNMYFVEGFVQFLQVWIYNALLESTAAAGFGKPIDSSPTSPLLSFLGGKVRKNVKENINKHVCFICLYIYCFYLNWFYINFNSFIFCRLALTTFL